MRDFTKMLYSDAWSRLIDGWRGMAEAHRDNYGAYISADYVLGPEWQAVGQGLLGLLNGELGKHEGGDLDRRIRQIFVANGYSDEGEL